MRVPAAWAVRGLGRDTVWLGANLGWLGISRPIYGIEGRCVQGCVQGCVPLPAVCAAGRSVVPLLACGLFSSYASLLTYVCFADTHLCCWRTAAPLRYLMSRYQGTFCSCLHAVLSHRYAWAKDVTSVDTVHRCRHRYLARVCVVDPGWTRDSVAPLRWV